MSQIGNPVKVVEVPRPVVAPVFDPPERRPEAEPLYDFPVREPVPVPVKREAAA